jgi:hypothetical protein
MLPAVYVSGASKDDWAIHGGLLRVVMSPVVASNEFYQGGRQIARLFGTAPAQLVGNVFGDVARLTLGGVEADDANRIAVLTV